MGDLTGLLFLIRQTEKTGEKISWETLSDTFMQTIIIVTG